MSVPLSSLALTRSGWHTWQNITIGDHVLALDTTSGTQRWTAVRDLRFCRNVPVFELANGIISMESTLDHRWWGAKYTDRGSRGRSYMPRFFSTTDFSPRHLALLSAPGETDRRLDLSPTEVAVITWLATDGHIVRTDPSRTGPSQAKGKKIYFGGSIFQKKQRYVDLLDDLLAHVPHGRYVRPSGIVQWKLAPQYLRDLWRGARLDELSWQQFVLHLDRRQRHAFTESCWQAEGYVSDVTRRMSQNAGDLLEAMRLGWFLDGYFVTASSVLSRTGKVHTSIRASKPRVTGQRHATQPARADRHLEPVHRLVHVDRTPRRPHPGHRRRL